MRGKCTNDKWIFELVSSDRYQVTADGRILTNLPEKGHPSIVVEWREKTKKLTTDGYHYIYYKSKKLCVHRIVFAAHGSEKLDENKEVNHKDGVRTNNAATNLELLTFSDNLKHSYQVLKRVINKGNRKFTADQVRSIRRDHKNGKSIGKISRELKKAKSTISYIVNGKTFSDVEPFSE